MATTKTFFQESNIRGFVAIVLVLIALAIGQLYVIAELDTLYFGIPLWVYTMLLLLSIMLVLAWVAVDVLEGRRW